jgi:hypothetical protein
VKYKEAGYGKISVYGSKDEKCWELLAYIVILAYCINYIFARKIKEEIENMIFSSISHCVKVSKCAYQN